MMSIEQLLVPLMSAGKYLMVMIPTMALGVIGVNLLFQLGVIDRIAWITRPLTRFGHLSDQAGVSFITAFGSPTAANTILVDSYDQGNMSKREMYLASLTNSFPAMLMHWRGMIPVLLPLLGLTGLMYFGILVLVGLVKTVLVLCTARLMLPVRSTSAGLQKHSGYSQPFGTALRKSIRGSKKVIHRILKLTIPVTVVAFLLIDLGFFKAVAQYLAGFITFLPVPTEALTIVSAQFGHHIAGYTLASNFLTKGVLSGYQVIVILLIGNVISSISNLRHYIPHYMGIFGPRQGLEIMLLATGIRQGLIVISICLLLYMQ